MDKLFDDELGLFAEVMLPVPIPRLFTYRIPRSMEQDAKVGSRVVIQFGTKKILTGIIAVIHQEAPKQYAAKPILDLLDHTPIMNDWQLKLLYWMSEYYLCYIGDALNAALPAGFKLSSESKIQLHPHFDPELVDSLEGHQEVIIKALLAGKDLDFQEIQDLLQIKSIHPIIKQMVADELVLVYEAIKDKYQPKIIRKVRLNSVLSKDQKALQSVFEQLNKKEKQLEILLKYLQEVPIHRLATDNEAGLDKSIFTQGNFSNSSLQTLVKNGIFEEFQVIVSRFDTRLDGTRDFTLSTAQQRAYEDILQQFETKSTVLLHGVTGSGKTELYIKLVQDVLAQGEQCLILLPEIALTAQIVQRLRRVFGDELAVYHSKFSDNERVETWNGLLEGRFKVIIGVRSSVFLPFDNLGLVIVDEEHEFSYKQYDPAPRYQARDTALMLANLHHAKTILGSATPSIESYANAHAGKFGLVKLHTRYQDIALPDIILADTKADRKRKKLQYDFSELLINEIKASLELGKQVMIFQNRRGYAPYLTCEDCAWIPQCERCDVSLTYHQFFNELRCHYCGFKQPVPMACEACGSTKIHNRGHGTEQIEESLQSLFPSARVKRMDQDTTRGKNAYQEIIDEFENGEIDILVGTQMISKGFDFERVGLVGVFDADKIIHFPDFRSNERAYQVLTQVAGRSGRKEKGKVIIQTADPSQAILHQVISQDFEGLFAHEMAERSTYQYPPYVRMIRVTVKHRDLKVSQEAAQQLMMVLKQRAPKITVLGPVVPLVSKIRNQYLQEIVIKMDRQIIHAAGPKKVLWQAIMELQNQKKFKTVTFVSDVDPY